MSTRILHCSTSVDNYNICLEQKIAGFSNKAPQADDLVYLAVKVGKQSMCGARFRLGEPTEKRPWPNGDKYTHALSIIDVEYCEPFNLSLLSQAGGAFWGIKYVQASKPILDEAACELLNQKFTENRVSRFIPFKTGTSPAAKIAPVILPLPVAEEEVVVPRDSFRLQALLADIGERMGYKIWLPKNDRSRVFELWKPASGVILENLPLNYDLDTINTIENIDVLWIQGRTIVRAFEVEHTTSIYSGILRMADLMALQPNLNIRAHIVAPPERRLKVMQELSRPVFKHTLAPLCTFISYTSIEELAEQKMLKFIKDAVLDDLSVSVKDASAIDSMV